MASLYSISVRRHPINILIVGAGPTGLTTARRIIPTVIDKRTEPSGLSRAVGILHSSLQLLAPSGVSEKLLHAGPVVQGICGYFNETHLLSINFSKHLNSSDHFDCQFPLHCLPQNETETILANRFLELGGNIKYGVTFVDLKQKDNSVLVTTTEDATRYDYVVGADGIASKIRQQLNINFTGRELPEPWSVADLDTADWPHPSEIGAFLMSNGNVCVAAPIGENRIRLASNTTDALKTLPIAIDVRHIRGQSKFTISVRLAERFSKNRVYLAGDAAHCHSPIGGRGMNLGIADAAQLAACLVNNTGDEYHDLRFETVKETIKLTERGRRLVTSNGRLSRTIKPNALKLINRSPGIKKRMIQTVLDVQQLT